MSSILSRPQLEARTRIYWCQIALRDIRKARDAHKKAGARRTLLRYKQLLDSAEGALRNARGQATRVGFWSTMPICLGYWHGQEGTKFHSCSSCGETVGRPRG